MILAKLLSPIWLAIVLGVCNGQPQLLPQQPIAPDTLITLRRTNCFYTCPDYLVTIFADGTVTFEGYANVRVKGTTQTKISREKMQLLVAAFVKAKYFSLRDSYSLPEDGCKIYNADADSAITSIIIDGKTKSVTHYLGCHRRNLKALFDLETKIDEVANTKQWIE
jgi:hypothetical protein